MTFIRNGQGTKATLFQIPEVGTGFTFPFVTDNFTPQLFSLDKKLFLISQNYSVSEFRVIDGTNVTLSPIDIEYTNGASPITGSNHGIFFTSVRLGVKRIYKYDLITESLTLVSDVNKCPHVITFNSLPNEIYGDASFKIFAEASSGLEVTFSSSDTTIAKIENDVVIITGAGTVIITVHQAGDSYYRAATPVEQTLVIEKATQTIKFELLGEKTVIDQPFPLMATSTSSLLIAYKSSNPSVATVLNGLLTILGTGKTIITASQVGDGNFEAAADVSQELTVVSRIIKLTGNLNFGEVPVNLSRVLSFSIQNEGTSPVTVTEIVCPDGYLSVMSPTSNGYSVITIFSPFEAGNYDSEIIVKSNATSGNNKISVLGTGTVVTAINESYASDFEVYPNPVANTLYINLREPDFHIQVFDMNGRLVKEANHEKLLDVSDLAVGIYQLFCFGNERYSIRFIKR